MTVHSRHTAFQQAPRVLTGPWLLLGTSFYRQEEMVAKGHEVCGSLFSMTDLGYLRLFTAQIPMMHLVLICMHNLYIEITR